MKNREDAEEVAQDVLMKVYRKVDAFRGDAALSSWIYRITFNTAMSRLRSSRLARAADQERERSLAAELEDGERSPRQPADWSRMPDEALLRAQLREVVARAIAELPEIYRAPVLLRDIQGLSTEEASTRLKLKDQTLKSRLHRGRLMLREKLQAFAKGLSLHRPTPAYS
jgi:RNA polymerase sigma-70 factor (ECF subfamily)